MPVSSGHAGDGDMVSPRDDGRAREVGNRRAAEVGDVRRPRSLVAGVGYLMQRSQRRRRQTRVGVAVLLIASAIGVLAAVVWLPPLLLDTRGITSATDRAKAINDFRGTLVTVLGGIAIAAGTVVAALNLRQNRRSQLTERFSKAVEQLGDEKLDIRLGGIYALEGIARDSSELHGPVMELLTAFVREHATARDAPEKAAAVDDETPHDGRELGGARPRLRADLQAVATVLGRRDVTHDPDGYELNLRDVLLGGVDFSFAQLRGANFREAHLQGADFSLAQLRGVDFREAQLQGADFTAADLRSAHFRDAQLYGADFTAAEVVWTDFDGADLRGAHLGDTKELE